MAAGQQSVLGVAQPRHALKEFERLIRNVLIIWDYRVRQSVDCTAAMTKCSDSSEILCYKVTCFPPELTLPCFLKNAVLSAFRPLKKLCSESKTDFGWMALP